MRVEPSQLKAFLLDANLATEKQLEKAEKEAQKTGKKLGDVLIGQKLIAEERLIRLEAYILGIPFVNLEKEIIPLLEKGIIVVCDRYFFSSLAYGAVGIKDANWLFQINSNFLLPDITFFLRVSPKICLERIQKNRHGITLFEQEQILEKVRGNYKRLVPKFKNIYVIPGERPADKIAKDIIGIVGKKLG